MAKPSVSLHASCDVPARQRIWEAIRTHHAKQQTFSIPSITQLLSDAPSDTLIYDYLRSLKAGAFIECVNPGRRRGAFAEYILIRDVGIEAPRVRRDGSEPPAPGREALWRTLKIIGNCTAQQLAEVASTRSRAVAKTTAEEYLMMLSRAGYVAVISESSPGTPTVFRLSPGRWSGPLAPQIRRTRELYDPNTGTVAYSYVSHVEGGQA
ncbi:hypothetical protein R84981_001733 [Carnimonas sp. R-84981]|uniref:hypothetical protein n=1 Tax=Carnimonas bestiolae TaxID=3402172 RepID=UPI003EDC8550